MRTASIAVSSPSALRPSGVAPFSSSTSTDGTPAARNFSAYAGPMPSISSMSPVLVGAASAAAGSAGSASAAAAAVAASASATAAASAAAALSAKSFADTLL